VHCLAYRSSRKAARVARFGGIQRGIRLAIQSSGFNTRAAQILIVFR
jgi:hypothetical protein